MYNIILCHEDCSLLYNLSTIFCIELTLGFQFEEYSFMEPPPGIARIAESICVAVRLGSVGTPLVITPSWTPDTAQGGCSNLHELQTHFIK